MAGLVWKCKIPLKIKVFLWQLFNDKLQTAHNLKKKGWKGDSKCCLCGVLETNDHTWLRGGVPLPNKLIIFPFVGISWALWNSRNKAAITRKFPRAPTDVIYNALTYMQSWSVGLKEDDQTSFEMLKGTLMEWLRNFKPSTMDISVIVEI